jgi:UDP-GlcNAc:undecaprenyl-phosphate GlcNAc-1-phosphate transferase
MGVSFEAPKSMFVVAALLASLVTAVFMFVLRPVAEAVGLIDVPGGRKRHGVPVPMIGGICMSVGLGFGAALVPHSAFWDPVLFGVYILTVVGVVDDRFDLPPNVRLVAQACAALLVVFASGVAIKSLGAPLFFELNIGPFAIPFTILFILTLINAFNIIDGIDGLAGGLALLALAALAVIGVGTEIFPLTLVLLGVVSSFLVFNLPFRFNRGMRTFMGDAGSTFLGLSIAAVGIWLSQGDAPHMSPVVGLWLVAVPVFDFFSTIVRRAADGRSPFAPDHEHLHHVLPEHGLSRVGTLTLMLSVAAICASIGIAGDVFVVPDGVLLVGWLAGGALYYRMLRKPGAVVRLIEAARGLGRPGSASIGPARPAVRPK